MTNQLSLSRQNAILKANRTWLLSKIALFILISTTLLSSISEIPSAFNISTIGIFLLIVTIVLLLILKRKHVPFVKIKDNQLQYYCPIKKELVVIPAKEITKVTTHFCELQIHTCNHTHCLNINKVKQENERWEIKEMIRKLAVENNNRAADF